ncbi:hypothetical protein D3C71_1799680 [compost metagenome]
MDGGSLAVFGYQHPGVRADVHARHTGRNAGIDKHNVAIRISADQRAFFNGGAGKAVHAGKDAKLQRLRTHRSTLASGWTLISCVSSW